MPVFGKQSRLKLQAVHPTLVKVLTEAIKTTPVDFSITDSLRTLAEQQHEYAKGRTIPGAIVTQCDGIKKKSNHQAHADGFCYAVDLYPYVNGHIDYDDVHGNLPKIASHIKEVAKSMGVKLRWGGDYKATKTLPAGWDRPHFELL